jgi:hypothetical protein
MSNWPSQFQPLSIVGTLFWAGILTSGLCFVTDRWLHTVLRSHWKLILISLALVLLWRIPIDGIFFHGLEYEDSYVYTVASRQMLEHVGSSATRTDFPYSINVCAIGSLKSCQEWESFPEHFIGYPYAVSLFSWVFGYTPDIASLVNVFAACLADILIFCVALLATNNVTMAGAAALVFAITPVFAVYGLETSAEPASNLCISLLIWFYMRLISAVGPFEGRWGKEMFWCAYTCALLFSLTVKREDMLLAIAFPMMLPFVVRHRVAERRQQHKLMILMLLSTALALILSVEMRLAQTTLNEAALLKTFPLKPERLAAFAFGFVRSFFVNQWYGGAIAAVIVGTLVSCRRRGLSLVPLFLFVAYLLLYAFHIRSYYEMRSGRVEPLAALRFSMSLMSLWALLAGMGVGATVTRFKTTHFCSTHKRLTALIAGVIVAALLGTSFAVTEELRNSAVEDESYVRISPARIALDFASSGGRQSDYVVTLEPLIIQMYADPTTRVIDLSAADCSTLNRLIASSNTRGFVLLEETSWQTEADLARYGKQTQYLQRLPSSIVYRAEEFNIVRLDPP